MSANEFFNKKKKGNWNNNNNIIIIIITTTFLRTIFSTRFPCPLYLPLGLRGWGVGEGAYLKGGLSKRVVKWAHQWPQVFQLGTYLLLIYFNA